MYSLCDFTNAFMLCVYYLQLCIHKTVINRYYYCVAYCLIMTIMLQIDIIINLGMFRYYLLALQMQFCTNFFYFFLERRIFFVQ